MGFDIQGALEMPARALKVRAYRAEVLGDNIANADTPGFKARDFSFRDAMRGPGATSGSASGSALGPRVLATRPDLTHARHLSRGFDGAAPVGIDLQYRVPLQPSLDQNTVETAAEQAAFTDNAIRYQATLQLMNHRVRGLLTAIAGQ